MRFKEILKSSFTTLKMNKRRTFLTMIGIIIGIASVITILSLGNGFRQQTMDDLAKDEQGRPSQTYFYNPNDYEADFTKIKPFTDELFEEIGQLPGVSEAKDYQSTMETTYYTTVRYDQDTQVTTVPYNTSDTTNYNIVVGRNLNTTDSTGLTRNAIIDVSLAYLLYGSEEEAYHKSVKIDNTDFTIVGVYASSFVEEPSAFMGIGMNVEPQMVIPTGTYDLINEFTFPTTSMIVYFEPDVDLKTAVRQVGDFLKEKGPEKDNGQYDYYDSSEMMESIGRQLNMITYFISSVAGISLFIAGVGVMNMMYISVSERTKEIGIRRSLGATKQSIQWQFLLEGICITALGGVAGYILGVAIAIGVGKFLPFQALIDVPTALLSLAISIIIGVVFSVFPARTAAMKNVVEILR